MRPRLDELREQHIDAAVCLLLNDTAANAAKSSEDAHEEVRKSVLLCSKEGCSFVLLDCRRNVIGVVLQEELKLLREQPIIIDESEGNCKNALAEGHKEEVIREAVMSTASAIEPRYSKHENYRDMWKNVLAINKLIGLKTYCAKVCNEASYKALLELGGSDISADSQSSSRLVSVDLTTMSSSASNQKSAWSKL